MPDTLPAAMPPVGRWTLQDAKARFSALVREARDRGPQVVTVHGQEAVVVLDAAAYAKLLPAEPQSLAALFADAPYPEWEMPEPLRERGPVRPLPEF